MPEYLYTIFLAIGLIFLAVACIIAYHRFDFLKRAIKTEGVITDFILPRGGYRVYMPVIEFPLRSGQKQSFTNFVGSNPNPHKVGERVTIFYDPANPSNAAMDSFFSLWLLPFIFGTIGTAFTVVGVLVWRFVP